jgi:hypothetical protein
MQHYGANFKKPEGAPKNQPIPSVPSIIPFEIHLLLYKAEGPNL